MLRLSGPEQFFSVSDTALTPFDADWAENCNGVVAYHANPSKFGGGTPGHTHPDGSSDPDENILPALGPDDGKAANLTGRAYMVSPTGITRIEHSHGTYSATLVQGSFGASDRVTIAQLSKFNRNAGSEVRGGTANTARQAGQCKPMRTH